MFRSLMVTLIAGAVATMAFGALAQPAPDPAPCASPPLTPKKKAKEMRESTAYFTIAAALSAAEDVAAKDAAAPGAEPEQPSKEAEQPPQPAPAACAVETFEDQGATIQALHTPGETADDRSYQFVVTAGDTKREIWALPQPLFALLYKEGDYTAVMETSGQTTIVYRVLRNEAAYALLRTIVLDILHGDIKPVIGVERSEGGDTKLNVYDLDRLSK